MADKRITDLPLILSGDISSNDVLPIVNVEDDITNKIEISQLKSYILSGATNQIITISGGTGILTGGTYPNFTITNTSPDQIVSISGGTNLSVVGTYPNFGINFTGETGGYTYEIGQYVPDKGGVIFHRWLSGTTQNYLVVDTTNLSVSAQWASVNVNIPNVESVWDGQANTSNLILAGAGSGITSGTAAVLCNNSTNNGQTDWYLPAAYEIATIWDNKFSVAIGLEQAGGQNLLLV
jgi:hypothetical protein